jgi:NO-binding membrane sensor protein with MHYT domain
MQVSYEPWLVLLSIVVAIQGAYVGLHLAVQIGAAAGMRRRLLLAGAAFSFGVAIWAMHFVGMLAARLPSPVDYLVFPTLLSFLVCVIVVGAAVFAANVGPPTETRLAAAAVVMGGGIVSMHYTGMTALHASAHMAHAPLFVGLSVAIAIAASGLALWLAAGHGGRFPLLLSATVLGIAIAGMHYTAMAGVTVFPHMSPPSRAPALSADLLAIVVAVVAFLVSGIFLLALVPDVGRQAAAAPDRQAGAHPAPTARRSPVEREGATYFVAVDDIVAVHANAHYTYVFDGTATLFCPLAIGDVESRLDTRRFIRVHRSHIVNIDRIVGLKRAGDNGIIELQAPDRYTVPVSRSRLTGLKSRLVPKPREAVLS